MPLRTSSTDPIPKPDATTGWALLACGLWLRVGYIGVSATIIGLSQLFGGGTTPLAPLGLVLGGGALAALGWRRAHSALQHADPPAATTAGESSARTAARTPAAA